MTNPGSFTENSDNRRTRGGQRRFSDNPVGQRILDKLEGRPSKWLADATGLNEKTVSDYIAKGISRADAAVAIAGAFGITTDWLLTGKPSAASERLADLMLPEDMRLGFGPDPDLVAIDEVDLRYGLGGSYIDGPVTVEKRQFSREWLSGITGTSPELL